MVCGASITGGGRAWPRGCWAVGCLTRRGCPHWGQRGIWAPARAFPSIAVHLLRSYGRLDVWNWRSVAVAPSTPGCEPCSIDRGVVCGFLCSPLWEGPCSSALRPTLDDGLSCCQGEFELGAQCHVVSVQAQMAGRIGALHACAGLDVVLEGVCPPCAPVCLAVGASERTD